jgi:Flp pilus assembly protein TadD
VALLAVWVASAFWPVRENAFSALDDPSYVTRNPMVLKGFTGEGVRWAFSSFEAANWHPLTWISHMADVSLFGLDPSPHHLMNLAHHLAAVLVLYLVMSILLGRIWTPLLAVLPFGVHPLRVESVAWLAERKDVLAALCGMLALLAHVGHARRPGPVRYTLVVIAFALGLLAKPVLVTLPLVLLVVDVWPLGRHRLPGPAWILAEKVPLLLLAAVSSVLTYLAQRQGGMVKPLAVHPAGERVANALVSVARYLGKLLYPRELYLPYPMDPSLLAPLPVLLAVLLLAAITLTALSFRRSLPSLLAGWAWFSITLIPVIGLVQVGDQAMADRYSYLPSAGLLLGLAGVLVPPGRSVLGRTTLIGILLVDGAFLPATIRQTRLWRDDLSLHRHAVAADPGNPMALANLGGSLTNAGHPGQALPLLREALRLRPSYPDAIYNEAMALLLLGDSRGARDRLTRYLSLVPRDPDARLNLGVLLAGEGRTAEALEQYLAALRERPGDPDALNNVGACLEELGRPGEAAWWYKRALEADPSSERIRRNLARVLGRAG